MEKRLEEKWIKASEIPASGIPEGYGVILDDGERPPAWLFEDLPEENHEAEGGIEPGA